METKIQNHGFIPSIIDETTHYIMGDGCLPSPDVLMPGGHGWGSFLPPDEVQARNGLETENCTNYGTLHAIATLGKRKFGLSFQTQLSERYTGILTGTTTFGNDPHKVAELIRTLCGVIPEVFLPFDDSIKNWQQYYSPKPMTWALLNIGLSWLKKYTFGHDWVFVAADPLASRQAKMVDALQYSPICVSGFAWSQHADGMYYSDQPYQNHWFEIYDFVYGQYWMAFDSYDNTHKKLDWNFDFGQCKRYSLSLKVGGDAPVKVPWIESLETFVKSYFWEIIK